VQHLPEECPAAKWYGAHHNTSACEAYFLTTPEGREAIAGLEWGTVEYYRAVIDGTREMHEMSECGL
jgi:hypothetical protein